MWSLWTCTKVCWFTTKVVTVMWSCEQAITVNFGNHEPSQTYEIQPSPTSCRHEKSNLTLPTMADVRFTQIPETSWLTKHCPGPGTNFTRKWVNLVFFLSHTGQLTHKINWKALVRDSSYQCWRVEHITMLICYIVIFFLQIQPGHNTVYTSRILFWSRRNPDILCLISWWTEN